MVWVKVDDKLHENDKLAEMSDVAFRLWVVALSWSNDKLTDGHIPAARPLRLITMRQPKNVVSALVHAQLWHLAARPCKACIEQRTEKGLGDPPSGGYLIHDYFRYQPSKTEVEREREARTRAGRIGGARSAEARAQASAQAPAAAHAQANGQAGAQADRSSKTPFGSSTGVEQKAVLLDPVSRTPVPPSSGSIDPVAGEDDPFPEDQQGADLSIRGGRREGVRHVGGAATALVAAARTRAAS